MNPGSPTHPKIVVLDFGSQVSQLIVRRLREVQVYSELYPWSAWRDALDDPLAAGIVLSGSPDRVLAPGSPQVGAAFWRTDKPLLGICYGMQLMCRALGGGLAPAVDREYGRAEIEVLETDEIFAGQPQHQSVWMSHGDRIDTLPAGFEVLARTDQIPMAAVADRTRRFYGLQFHPEVAHTDHGEAMLEAFARRICGIQDRWTPAAFITETVAAIAERVGDGRVLCAVSGGVDSTVMAALVDRAVGARLHAVYVDNGLMRLGESDQVERDLNAFLASPVQRVDAGDRFLSRLAGVADPERKRKIIGRTFIEVFTEGTRAHGPFGFLAQGTLYPDRIESQSVHGPSSVIKTHHNVGGLPAELGFELIEPLRDLFKDEVRGVGRELGVPPHMLARHPFPGPGLAVRILGEVSAERVSLLQRADHIFIEELRSAGQYDAIWQAGAILLPVRSVGVMGDERTYEHVVALRAVTSTDGMTADWARVPAEILARVANRIINEVVGVNRVVYDISSKPPSTIEWE